MLRILRRGVVLLVVLGFICAARDLIFAGNLNYWFQWLLLAVAVAETTPYMIERWRK